MNFKKRSQKRGEGEENKIFLSLSLVLHHPSKQQLQKTLETLSQALRTFPKETLHLLVIDNSPNRPALHKKIIWRGVPTEIISGLGNLGFGRAHNLILEKNRLGKFHLILNPDLRIEKEALENGIRFLSHHPEFGLCAPVILNNKNQLTHLGRAFPDIFSLGLRGFTPNFLRPFFQKYLDFYEMTALLSALHSDKIVKDIPCLSGSFLLMRGEIFQQLKGFDPTFFLYFEDFDLSLRAQKITRTALLPQMIIQHFGGQTSQKGFKHIFYFIRSACQFYRKHGWRFYKR